MMVYIHYLWFWNCPCLKCINHDFGNEGHGKNPVRTGSLGSTQSWSLGMAEGRTDNDLTLESSLGKMTMDSGCWTHTGEGWWRRWASGSLPQVSSTLGWHGLSYVFSALLFLVAKREVNLKQGSPLLFIILSPWRASSRQRLRSLRGWHTHTINLINLHTRESNRSSHFRDTMYVGGCTWSVVNYLKT